jgi:(2Fe-2S) ferredoxin
MTTTSTDDCPGTPIPAGNYTAAAPYIDHGNTTGANDTVSRIPTVYYYYYYYYYGSFGPDRIYSFVVNGTGNDSSITVTSDLPSYRPMIYVTDGCPAGLGNTLTNNIWAIYDSQWGTDNTAKVNVSNLPGGRRYYLFVDSRMAAEGGAYTLTLKDMQIASSLPVRANRPDFDGDGRSDLSVYRPSNSTWYTDASSGGFSATQFGISTDQNVPEDYDGDGKTDIAVFRDGDWWILKSSDSTPMFVHWGSQGDIPVPGDYTGDGQSDIAIFRDGQWWINDLKTGQYSSVDFGQSGDKPVPGDYTGDGRSDIAVFRSGQWWIYDLGTGQYSVVNFGQAGDRPVPGDYDGDGKADPAVYRDGTWYQLRSSQGSVAVRWGLSTDIVAPGDYDGDGKTDAAVYRDGTWYLLQSRNGMAVRQFGLADDNPVPAGYFH